MLPRIQPVKVESYPKEEYTERSSNILKLKFIQQFLDQEMQISQNLGGKSGRSSNGVRGKQNVHRRENSTLSTISQLMADARERLANKAVLTRRGRQLRLSQLYDFANSKSVKSEQLQKSFAYFKRN